MVSYRDIVNGIKQLNLPPGRPVIAHASLSEFGEVQGGARTLLGALTVNINALMMPTFTYRTMITPETGPENNGISYGSGRDMNRMADFFKPTMPADRLMGVLAELLRQNPQARRSVHPILSFSGIGVESALEAQKLKSPLAPIQDIVEKEGWVLLLGVDHTVNTSIHLAEWLSGRKQFTRWALTPHGIYECPNYPGCSDGFQQAIPLLARITRHVEIGEALVQALPLSAMIEILTRHLQAQKSALLCNRPDCERCNSVRHAVARGL